jgi:catechol 2,3-dioxygenase-like lactoylglutathione lyase family enzyme
MPMQSMMMVTIQVRDFDAMVAWYRDTLGLDVGWLEPTEFCSLLAPGGGAAISLATDHPDRIANAPGLGWTPIMAVTDFDDFVAGLRSANVEFDADEEGAGEGYRLVRILDPEGNPIGITASRS